MRERNAGNHADKTSPGVPWDAGGGAKAEALTLPHLETDFREAQVIDLLAGFFGP
jgi:hypothetical protein